MKTSIRALATLVAAFGVIALTGAPAQATTGGGCREGYASYIASCISYNGGFVYGDFYVNWDAGCKKAVTVIYVDGGASAPSTPTNPSTITYVGRYGPWSVRVSGYEPPRLQHAFTRINYYTCNWDYLGQVDSPTVTFYA